MPNHVKTRIQFCKVTDSEFDEIVKRFTSDRDDDGTMAFDFEKIIPMPDRKRVIKGLEICSAGEWNSTGGRDCTDCPYYPAGYTGCTCKLLMRDALALLKEQEVPEELKHRMWNALYAEEDKFEKKYVGTKDHDNWFNTYRPWLQDGFNLAIKAIADWEEGEV